MKCYLLDLTGLSQDVIMSSGYLHMIKPTRIPAEMREEISRP